MSILCVSKEAKSDSADALTQRSAIEEKLRTKSVKQIHQMHQSPYSQYILRQIHKHNLGLNILRFLSLKVVF
jgi:hypothetical protein